MEWVTQLFEQFNIAIQYMNAILPADVGAIVGAAIAVLVAVAIWKVYKGGST